MILLAIINALSVLTCMYALISERYKTKSKDVTIIFICLQILFLCNLWASIDGSIILMGIFIIKNLVNIALLIFCMYSVRKNETKNGNIDNYNHNLVDKLTRNFKSIIKRITTVAKETWIDLKL